MSDQAKIKRVIKLIHELVGWVKRLAVSMVVALEYLANICNLVRVHVCFIYLTVFSVVKTGDT